LRNSDPNNLCPLKEADCGAMNAILKRVAARREYLQKLDELGLDVANLIDENEAQAKFCTECKAKFFPDMQ
jgi:hypothetical protein